MRRRKDRADAQRAAMISAIRGLADLLEARPELPAPTSVRAQASILAVDVPDYENRTMIALAAAQVLGTELEMGGECARYVLSPYPNEVQYVVHAQPAADLDD
jgi:hypothetical protein